MTDEHSLKPLWIGITCMAVGVLLIYWAFHSGNRRIDGVPVAPNEGEVCAQVITAAKNLETGEVVEYPTPCDVPDGWEIMQPEVVE